MAESGKRSAVTEPSVRATSAATAAALSAPVAVLGFRLPDERFRSAPQRFDKAEIAFDKRADRRLGAHLCYILVHPADPEDRARQWRCVTDWICNKL